MEYDPGTTEDVAMHDGTVLRLTKLAPDYTPTDRAAAYAYIQEKQAQGEIVTGLLYIDKDQSDMHQLHNSSDRPMNALPFDELCPGSKALESIQSRFR